MGELTERAREGERVCVCFEVPVEHRVVGSVAADGGDAPDTVASPGAVPEGSADTREAVCTYHAFCTIVAEPDSSAELKRTLMSGTPGTREGGGDIACIHRAGSSMM